MDKILVLFGSKSDEVVYKRILNYLKDKEIHYEMRISSAHRTPDEIEQILKTTDAKVIIAGAGLAAHLPGVVASKTIKPIIGVPVKSNYMGLDALLSIMQMPPGIPVLSVGVDAAEEAAKKACVMLEKYETINIIGDKEEKSVKKAITLLKEFDAPFTINKPGQAIDLNFLPIDQPPAESENLTINVPSLGIFEDKAEAALQVLQNSSSGLWVGLGRGDNAALAAIEILNIHGNYDDKLTGYRKKHAQKVKDEDKKVNKGDKE